MATYPPYGLTITYGCPALQRVQSADLFVQLLVPSILLTYHVISEGGTTMKRHLVSLLSLLSGKG